MRYSKALLFVSIYIILAYLVNTSNAIPLGGKGSQTREKVKGSFEVVGQLTVSGVTTFNNLMYKWPASHYNNAYLINDGGGTLFWKPVLSPKGKNGSVQILQGDSLFGDSDLVWDSKKLMISGTLEALGINQNGIPVSLSGHYHRASDISAGIVAVENGGTGTDSGSINAKGPLVLSSGGEKNDIILNPAGGANIIIKGSVLTSGSATIDGDVSSNNSFYNKGVKGIDQKLVIVSDMKLQNNKLMKRMSTVTISGGIITSVDVSGDWIEAGELQSERADNAK